MRGTHIKRFVNNPPYRDWGSTANQSGDVIKVMFTNIYSNMTVYQKYIGTSIKPQCWEPPGHYLCTPEPDRLGCVISIQIGVNGDAYPVAISEKAKEKYRGMFEIQKSRDKTSSGEIGLDIRTHASPKVGQDQVSGGVSVLCWHAAPVARKVT